MKRIKYIFVLFVGTFVYVTLSLCFGQNSMKCYNQLEEQKRIVSKQKVVLQNINTELQLELAALKNDRAIMAAYARKLGYVSEGEKLVKINGLKPTKNVLFETGTVVRHVEPDFVSEKLCKIAAFCSALFVLIMFLLFDFKNGNLTFSDRKNEPLVINGIPVYDVAQV